MERFNALARKHCLTLLCALALQLAPPLLAQTAETETRVLFEAALIDAAMPPAPTDSTVRSSTNVVLDESPLDQQQTRPSQRLAEIAQYRTLMDADIEAGGAFAAGLFQSQAALGERYQELKLHESAIEAFDEARHLIRVQQGLEATEQQPLLQASIESHLALGELTEALDLHQTLEDLLLGEAQTFSNLELAEAYIRAGDAWQQSADTLRSMGAERRYRISRLLDNNPGSPARSRRASEPGNTDALKATRLMYTADEASALFSTPAQHFYAEAMSLLTEAQAWSHPRLIEFEYRLMRTIADLYGPYRNYWRGGARQKIADSLQRVVSYTAYDQESTVAELATRMLEAGDWHLYTVKTAQAHRQYADTLKLLSQLNVAPAEIMRLLNPPVPREIPTLLPSAHSRAALGIAPAALIDYDGFIDVAFRINKYGRTSRIKVNASSSTIDPQLESILRDYLEEARFRPAIDSEGKTHQREVQLRYHFANSTRLHDISRFQ